VKFKEIDRRRGRVKMKFEKKERERDEETIANDLCIHVKSTFSLYNVIIDSLFKPRRRGNRFVNTQFYSDKIIIIIIIIIIINK